MSDFNLRPLAVIDFETTGEDPSYHDLIEMGAILVDSQSLNIIDSFEVKIPIMHPERVQLEALAVNGYTEEQWKTAINLYDSIKAFEGFVETRNAILCAWNVTFETQLLAEAYRRLNQSNPFSTRNHSHKLDIPSMVWIKYSDISSLSYDRVASFLGLKPETKPHAALGGALHNLAMFKKLRGIE